MDKIDLKNSRSFIGHEMVNFQWIGVKLGGMVDLFVPD